MIKYLTVYDSPVVKELLDALLIAHRDLDLMLAQRCALQNDFRPTQSAVWPNTVARADLLRRSGRDPGGTCDVTIDAALADDHDLALIIKALRELGNHPSSREDVTRATALADEIARRRSKK